MMSFSSWRERFFWMTCDFFLMLHLNVDIKEKVNWKIVGSIKFLQEKYTLFKLKTLQVSLNLYRYLLSNLIEIFVEWKNCNRYIANFPTNPIYLNSHYNDVQRYCSWCLILNKCVLNLNLKFLQKFI